MRARSRRSTAGQARAAGGCRRSCDSTRDLSSAPAVSAIIIFLDAEKFLAEAIESVLAQDFSDWELALVDDGSSDASTQIALRYAARHPGRIRYLAHAGRGNRGMSASRNLGIAQSRAPLIAFLDADDVWMPEKLSAQVALMREQPEAAVVFGQTKFWFSWSGAAPSPRRDFVWRLDAPTDALFPPPSLLYHAPLGNCLKPSMSNFMMRRSQLDRIGRFEESFRNLHEDYVFWIKVFANATVYHAEACWDWCRHHRDSFSNVRLPPRQAREEAKGYERWVIDYFASRRVADPYLRALLAQFELRARHPRVFRFLPQYHLQRLRRVLHRLSRTGLRQDIRGRLVRLRRGAW